MTKTITAILLITIILIVTSCSSTYKQVEPILTGLQNGKFAEAKDQLIDEKNQKELLSSQGPIVLGLDIGMLSYYASDYETSNKALNSAETEIYKEFTASLAAGVATYLINDNSKAYPGERYEDIYLNIFKSLNYYHLGSSDSAMVEIRKSIDKIEELKKVSGSSKDAKQMYDTEFVSSALSLYLGMIYSRGIEDSNYFNYCLKNIPETYLSQKNIYNFKKPVFLSDETYTYRSGKARLNFISFTGLAPYKEEENEYIRINAVTQRKLSYPVLAQRESKIKSIKISIPEANIKSTMELVEDFDTVIQEIFEMRQKEAINKAEGRSSVKAGIADATADYVKNSGDVKNDTSFNASLVFVVKSLATETESADVRGSHFFPSKAWGYGVTLDEGVYDIKIEFLDLNGKVLHTENIIDYPVYSDKTNLIDSFYLI